MLIDICGMDENSATRPAAAGAISKESQAVAGDPAIRKRLGADVNCDVAHGTELDAATAAAAAGQYRSSRSTANEGVCSCAAAAAPLNRNGRIGIRYSA